MRRIRHRRQISIRRDDHIGDLLGAIFLDFSPARQDSIIDRLSEYLGPRVRIIKAEMSPECADVEVEVQALVEEGARLAAAANDLRIKGARRNALAMFRQALELDPLSRTAALGLGTLLADMEQYDEAIQTLKRARETGASAGTSGAVAEDVELLLTLGRVCMRTERTASAITYLERAFEIDSGNFAVRRLLAELGRKPRPPMRAPAKDQTSSAAPAPPANKQH
ncbi:MAG: tetratricopeptide repeat protein [Candidatus Binataceae bacterium]|nr:tetratricopeptide repeat protein [Candidatus Binataceae bacterium]